MRERERKREQESAGAREREKKKDTERENKGRERERGRREIDRERIVFRRTPSASVRLAGRRRGCLAQTGGRFKTYTRYVCLHTYMFFLFNGGWLRCWHMKIKRQ